MTILWTDGFDNYSSDNPISTRWTVTTSGAQYGTAGRFGGLALKGGGTIQHPLPSAKNALSVGFALNTALYPGSLSELLGFLAAGVDQARLMINSAGDLQFGYVSNGTFHSVVTASGVIPINAWTYLEVELTRDASAGAVRLYVNGANVASATGVDTGAADPTAVALAFPSAGFLYDDYYCVDGATRLGECRFQTLPPTADTATKDFTPASGSDNFAMVDALPITGTSDFVSAAASGKSDLYTTGGLTGTVGTILAVMAVVTAKKTDTGFRSITPRLVSGGTDATNAAAALGTSYSQSVTIAEVDPATGVAWTETGVNAAEVGMETGS